MGNAAPQTSGTLAEMLQQLATSRGTGVLKAVGPDGWKVVEIQAGTITLVSAAGGKRLKLGEILVGRGKVPREAVTRALAVQQQSGAPLGQILAERGTISRAEIQEIVRFQIEEELYDLFAWPQVECSFEPEATIGGQAASFQDSAKLTIDPQKVFAEVAQRVPVWEKIRTVIYSRYMSFVLTERGEAMLSTATRGGRRLLELVRDGYCVETIVRKAVVGSFSIWKALVDLAEAQAVRVIPDAELTALADSYDGQGKIEQAWGAYMRLAEVTTDKNSVAAFSARVQALKLQIDQMTEKGLFDMGPEGVRGKRSWRAVRLAIILIIFVVVAAALSSVGLTGRAKPEDLTAYKQALRKAGELDAKGDFTGARQVWQEILAQNPPGTVATMARAAMDEFEEKYDRIVDREIERALTLETEKRYSEAVALFDEINHLYPQNKRQARISELKARTDKAWAEHRRKLTRDELTAALAKGESLVREQRYSEAGSALETVAKSDAAGVELRQKARELLAQVQEVEAKAEALVASAGKWEKEKKYEEAIRIYEQCYKLFSTSSWGRIAADRLTNLSRDKVRAERLYQDGVRRYREGDFNVAVAKLREAETYDGFECAAKAAEQLRDIVQSGERSEDLSKRAAALRAANRDAEAFGLLVELIERFPHSQAARGVTLEVRVESAPTGARVVRDGEAIGVTPFLLRAKPTESAVLTISKKGFGTVREQIDRFRSPVIMIRLPREVAYRRGLGVPIHATPSGGQDRYFVRAGSKVTAFLRETGSLVWQIDTSEQQSARSRPVSFEDAVYVGLHGAQIVGLLQGTGQQKHVVTIPAPPATSPAVARLSLLANNLFVVVGCIDGQIVSVNVDRKSVRWANKFEPPIRFDPVINERHAFFPLPGGIVVALDLLSGAVRWQGKVPGEVASDLAIDEAGKLVGALASLGEALVFNADNGQIVSRMALDGCRGGGIAIREQIAYVAGKDSRFLAFDTRSTAQLWSREVKGSVVSAPVVHNGNVYVGTEENVLVSADVRTGVVRWTVDVGSPVVASPLVEGDKCIVVTSDGEIVGLELGTED